MSNTETWNDGVAHENRRDRVGSDAILTHLIDELLSQPHTPEEREVIQGEITKRFLEILQPTNKGEDE